MHWYLLKLFPSLSNQRTEGPLLWKLHRFTFLLRVKLWVKLLPIWNVSWQRWYGHSKCSFIYLYSFFFLSLLYHDDRIWHCNVYNNYCLWPILFIDSGESKPYLHGIFQHQYAVLDVKKVEIGGVILIDIYEDKGNLKDLTYRKIIEKHLEIIINLDQGQNTTK